MLMGTVGSQALLNVTNWHSRSAKSWPHNDPYTSVNTLQITVTELYNEITLTKQEILEGTCYDFFPFQCFTLLD
jgi:hypothetical protein